MSDPMTTTQAPEGVIEAIEQILYEVFSPTQHSHDITEAMPRIRAALSVPVNGQGSGSSADADTHRGAGPAVVVPRDEQGRTAYDIIRDSNHQSAMKRAGIKDRSRDPLLGPPTDMAVSRVILSERPDETPETADLLAVKINDALAAQQAPISDDTQVAEGSLRASPCVPGCDVADGADRLRVIAAAYEVVVTTGDTRVVRTILSAPPPARHHNLCGLVHHGQELGLFGDEQTMRASGFVLSDGTYADRQRAARVAIQAGQVRAEAMTVQGTLFSEDLW